MAAINDRSIGDRAAELLDSFFVRHDLVELCPDSRGPGMCPRFRVHDHLSHARLPVDIEDIFGAGDRAAVRLRMTGTPARPCPDSPPAAASRRPVPCSSTASAAVGAGRGHGADLRARGRLDK